MARTPRLRIMVINDDATFLNLMRELLEDEGYKVFLVNEGDGAHEAVRRDMPALVILDIRLEHPDTGWMVLQALRLDPQTAEIPVIICSADALFLRGKQDWLARQGYLVQEKPFGLDDILAKITASIKPRTA